MMPSPKLRSDDHAKTTSFFFVGWNSHDSYTFILRINLENLSQIDFKLYFAKVVVEVWVSRLCFWISIS